MNAPTIIAAPSRSVTDIAQRINGTLRGRGDAFVKGINTLKHAGPDEITFITTIDYTKQWPKCRAAAAIVNAALEASIATELVDDRPVIFVPDAERASITLLDLFQRPEPVPDLGVHPSAVVHETASLGQQVRIGPHVSIDRGAVIGNEVVLHAGVRIYASVSIGDRSILHANTVIRHECSIGSNVIIHQNVSIGADGFGYRPTRGGRGGVDKIAHLGNVVIEDDVEIGAGTCIDRAKFGSTVIGAGSKIDNLCQIAHNCVIGRCCLIAGQVGMAGSVNVCDGAQIGGQGGIIDHLVIGAGARIAARSFVINDVPAGESWAGYPAGPSRSVLREWASIRKLPGLLRRLARNGPENEQ